MGAVAQPAPQPVSMSMQSKRPKRAGSGRRQQWSKTGSLGDWSFFYPDPSGLPSMTQCQHALCGGACARAESADGTLRTLVLSIEDHVNFLDGRKIKRMQEAPRWIDAYTVPGQFVAVRYPPDPVASASTSGIQDGTLIGLLHVSDSACRSAAASKGCDASDDIILRLHAEASTSSSNQNGLSDNGDIPTARTLFAISSSPYHARVDSANLDASIIEVIACPTAKFPVGFTSQLIPLRTQLDGACLLFAHMSSVIVKACD